MGTLTLDLKKLSFHMFTLGALLIFAPILVSLYYSDTPWLCAAISDIACRQYRTEFLSAVGVTPSLIFWLGIGICVVSQIMKYSTKVDNEDKK